MTIKYKFNKSSEERDCVVESVELVREEITEFEAGEESKYCKMMSTNKVYSAYFNRLTSPQQLKDYISTIQEPIEFIAESSIDDVLMKEWIGEWDIIYCNKELTDDLFTIQYLQQSEHNNPQYIVYYHKNQEIGIVSVQSINESTVTLHPKFNKKGFGYKFYMWYSKKYSKTILQSKDISSEATKMWKKLNTNKSGSPKLNSNWTFKIK